jgi:hypothetical protein
MDVSILGQVKEALTTLEDIGDSIVALRKEIPHNDKSLTEFEDKLVDARVLLREAIKLATPLPEVVAVNQSEEKKCQV